MTTWSRLQYPSSYTLSVSWLVTNAECCTLTIDSMHCGVCSLLYEVFNYTFPLLIVHVLVFELYPATPQHCPDQFCLLRLRCILPWKLASASSSYRKSLCACLSCARWLHRSFFVVLNARSSRQIWSSLPILLSNFGDLPSYSLLAVSSWNHYTARTLLNCYGCSTGPSSICTCSYQRC